MMSKETLQELREANTVQRLLEIYYDTDDADADVVINFAYELGKREAQ